MVASKYNKFISNKKGNLIAAVILIVLGLIFYSYLIVLIALLYAFNEFLSPEQKQAMFKLVGIVILGLVIYLLVNKFWGGINFFPKYTGFYYPNARDLTTYKQSSELSSLEQCREWVDYVSSGRTDTNFDYECGKNCKLSETGGIYICDETLE